MNHDHGDSALESAEWFRKQRLPDGETELSLERYRAARHDIEQMRRYSVPERRLLDNTATRERPAAVPAAGSWTALGPGNVGGRTRSFLIDPKNPNTMYAGGVTGGVWKLTDAGKSWTPTFDTLPTVSVGAMAMDPTDSTVLYAGTGESYQGYRGQGIFKSTNGGSSWAQLPKTADTTTSGGNFYYVNKLVISPNNHLQIYAATNTGVWSSPDGGTTWSQISTFSALGGCQDLAIRPDKTTDFLFASCFGATGGTDHVIYRNVDVTGSGVWEQTQTAAHMGRASLAIAPSQPSTIYALAADSDSSSTYSQGLLAFFRSTSDGAPGTWETRTSNQDSNRLNTALLSYHDDAFADVCGTGKPSYKGQGDYDNIVVVDPLDANKVWAGGIDVYRSDDGGANWGVAMFWDAGPPFGSHADNHLLVFPPNYDGAGNQTVYSLNDGGIFLTTQARGATAGQSAVCYPYTVGLHWVSLNNGYAATQFYYGAVYPGATAYFGGTQDNGTPRGTDAAGVNGWVSVDGGDGGTVAIDPIEGSTIYVENTALSLNKSVDGGITLNTATTGIKEPSGNFPFIAYYAMDPNNSLRLYIGGKTLWRTSDGAATWSAASGAVPQSITAIAVSPLDPNHVLFATVGGQIYRTGSALTASGAAAWTSVQPRAGFVAALAFDPTNDGIVYAAYSTFKGSASNNHIYKSTDGGATWTGMDGSGNTGFPDIPALTIKVDPRSATDVYVGTDIGLFVSVDGGNTWAHADDPFQSAMIDDLEFDYSGTSAHLVVFTFGRGAWRAPLPNNTGGCTYSVSPTSVVVDPAGGTGSITVQTNPGCPWNVLPGAGNFVVPQSPAKGIGPGQAFYTAAFNTFGTPQADALFIQGQKVTFTQAGARPIGTRGVNDEIATATVVPNLPYAAYEDDRQYTSNATDPTHSCTGSRDFKTVWWTVIAPSSGTLQIVGQGGRYDVYGNLGLVLSAYQSIGGAAGPELACAGSKRDTNTISNLSITVNVTQGTTYLIEASASTNDGGLLSLAMSMIANPSIGVTPAVITAMPKQKQQFQANLTNSPNTAVRWTVLPPLGIIAPDGTYTAPAFIDAPQTAKVYATSLANPSIQASATVNLTPPPVSFTAAGITSAATFIGGAVAPGEIITIFGTNVGPGVLAGLQLGQDGKVTSSVSGTQVFFDGIAAPIVYVQFGQTAVVVPYEVAGKGSTQVQVVHNGLKSPIISVPVGLAAPGLFTASASGSGQAAMLNQNGQINSTQFPAAPGSIVTLYGTGEGQSNPIPIDGSVTAAPFPKPVQSVTVQIGGQPADVLYAGPAPSLVAGVLQVNVRVPANVPSGNASVVVTVGNVSSAPGVTMSVVAP